MAVLTAGAVAAADAWRRGVGKVAAAADDDVDAAVEACVRVVVVGGTYDAVGENGELACVGGSDRK